MSSKRKKNITEGQRATKMLALLREELEDKPNSKFIKGKLKEKSKTKDDSMVQNITDENNIPSTSSGHGKLVNKRRLSLRSSHTRNPHVSPDHEKCKTSKKRSIPVKYKNPSTPAKRNKTECSSDDSIIENSPDSSLTTMVDLSKHCHGKLVNKRRFSLRSSHTGHPHVSLDHKKGGTSKQLSISVKHEVPSTPAKRNKTECSSDDSIIKNSPDSSITTMAALTTKIFLKAVIDKPTDKILSHTLFNENDDDLLSKVADSVPISRNVKCVSLSDLTDDTMSFRNLRRHLSAESTPFSVNSGLIIHYNQELDTQDTIEDIDCVSAMRSSDNITFSKIRSLSLSDLTTDVNKECLQRYKSFPAINTLFSQGSVLETEPGNDLIAVKQATNISQDEISSHRIFVDKSPSSLLTDTDKDLIKIYSESVPLSRAKALSLSDLTIDTFTRSKNIRRYNSCASISSQVHSEMAIPYKLNPVRENERNSKLNLRRQGFRSCRQETVFQDIEDNIDCMQESATATRLSDYALLKVRSLSLSDLTSGDIKNIHWRRWKSTPTIAETFSCTPYFDRSMFELIENELDNDDEYYPSDMINESSDSSTAIEFGDEEHSHGNTNNRKRRKKSMRSEWKKNIAKEMRMKGEVYLGYTKPKGEKAKQDTIRPARQLGEACKSDFCRKSKLRGCGEIDEKNRKNIHGYFWKKLNWDQRKIYVASLVKRSTTGRKTIKTGNSRRVGTLQYFLPLEKNNDTKVQVCKEMFLSTLSLGSFTVQNWVKNTEYGMSPNQAVTFLDKLPKLPSHYARKETTKLYLEPNFQSLRELYRSYTKYCTEENLPSVCRYTFEEKFHERNLSLHTLKKDKCDTCCAYEVGNLNEADYQVHIIKKNRARQEKTDDKDKADKKEAIVLTMDLEAVKSCPFLTASALYFKTKLVCHNFTVYNLSSRHCTCYWFDETAADLTASTFASCLVDYLERHCLPLKLPIIIFSDGCTYQNRNAVMANALLHLSKKHGVEIIQKYLEPGHTQMECDSVHSNIEQKLKNREIHLPSDYATLTKEIRKNQPYEVVRLDYDFVKDYANSKTWSYKSIRPGRKTGELQVVDIRAIRYNPDSTIQVMLDFDSEWMDLPQKCFAVRQTVLANLHAAPIPIKLSKYNHLQQLKSVLPRDCHSFYDSLPHEVD